MSSATGTSTTEEIDGQFASGSTWEEQIVDTQSSVPPSTRKITIRSIQDKYSSVLD